MKREYILIGAEGDTLKLPVAPHYYDDTSPHINHNFETLEIGEIKAIGRRGLSKIVLESHFPSSDRPYCTYNNIPSAEVCKATITRWKNANKPIRLIITGTDINKAYAIEEFTASKNDGTGDIYYTLSLEEYRHLNVPRSDNPAKIKPETGLKDRPAEVSEAQEKTIINRKQRNVEKAFSHKNKTPDNPNKTRSRVSTKFRKQMISPIKAGEKLGLMNIVDKSIDTVFNHPKKAIEIATRQQMQNIVEQKKTPKKGFTSSFLRAATPKYNKIGGGSR